MTVTSRLRGAHPSVAVEVNPTWVSEDRAKVLKWCCLFSISGKESSESMDNRTANNKAFQWWKHLRHIWWCAAFCISIVSCFHNLKCLCTILAPFSSLMTNSQTGFLVSVFAFPHRDDSCWVRPLYLFPLSIAHIPHSLISDGVVTKVECKSWCSM